MTGKAFVLMAIICLVLWGCFGGTNAEPKQDETVESEATPVPTSTPAPTPASTPTPAPTPVPTPTPEPTPDDDQPPVSGSDGCGNLDFPGSGIFSIDIEGIEREYIVSLPGNYDPNTAFRLVFAWHSRGSSAEEIAASNYYGLELFADGSVIFVAGQGSHAGHILRGWYNTDGFDVDFARAMYEQISSRYCVDEQRVFSAGMGDGGTMSNTLGCAMGDVFRAIAIMSSPEPEALLSECAGAVAVWISHGTFDISVPLAHGEDSRDYWLAENSCSYVDNPVPPDPCVAYAACQEGYPVHWCEFDGRHEIPSFAAEAIWRFFLQF